MLTTLLLLSLLILGGGWWYLNRTEVIEVIKEQLPAQPAPAEEQQRVTVQRPEVPPPPDLADKPAQQAVEPASAPLPVPETSLPETEIAAQQPDQAADQAAEEELRPSPATTPEKEIAAQAQLPDQAAGQPAEEEPRPSPAATTEPESLPLLADLPFSTRSMLPELKLRGHVYSETPSQRMIMVNTSIAREGDAITPDLSLVEITEDGLIMRFRDTFFRIEMF
jgi:general secretion pathway protein B